MLGSLYQLSWALLSTSPLNVRILQLNITWKRRGNIKCNLESICGLYRKYFILPFQPSVMLHTLNGKYIPRPPKGSQKMDSPPPPIHTSRSLLLHWGTQGIIKGFHFFGSSRGGWVGDIQYSAAGVFHTFDGEKPEGFHDTNPHLTHPLKDMVNCDRIRRSRLRLLGLWDFYEPLNSKPYTPNPPKP